MKNKCYIKKLIIICLIIAMTGSLYAADTTKPDAFITKERFDKSLADFQKRITEFQSGVNSKIDAQVSTYLDRNGIWNPSAIVWDGGGMPSHELTFADMGGDYAKYELRTVKALRFKGVANKMGLCYITFRQRCTHPAVIDRWQPTVRMKSAQYAGFVTMMYLYLVAGQYEDAAKTIEVQKYGNVIAKSFHGKEGVWGAGDAGSDQVMVMPVDNTWVISFFVEKGPMWVGFDVLRIDANGSEPKLHTHGIWGDGGIVTDSIDRAFVY